MLMCVCLRIGEREKWRKGKRDVIVTKKGEKRVCVCVFKKGRKGKKGKKENCVACVFENRRKGEREKGRKGEREKGRKASIY
jgi:hypothetical protein